MKKLSISLAIIVVAFAAFFVALVTLIDPNQFKPLIVEQTKKATGLDLIMNGEIHWQFYPTIGFSVGETELRNPHGFTHTNLIKINQAAFDISLWPILNHHLEIGKIKLDGAKIHLETRHDGASNLDSFRHQATESSDPAVREEATSHPGVNTSVESKPQDEQWQVSLVGLSITNASVSMSNKQAGSEIALSDVNFDVTDFVPDQWTHVRFSARGDLEGADMDVDGKADLKFARNYQLYATKDAELSLNLNHPSVKLKEAKLTIPAFELGQVSPVHLTLQGNSAGKMVTFDASTDVLVDQALEQIALNHLTSSAVITDEQDEDKIVKMALNGQASYRVDKHALSVILASLKLNQAMLDGQVDVSLTKVPDITLDLHSPDLDVDALLMQLTSPTTVESGQKENVNTTSPSVADAQKEPDLSALTGFNLAVKLIVDKLKVNHVDMQKVNAVLSGKQGHFNLTRLDASLYQGTASVHGQLDVTTHPATYQVHKQVSGVHIRPLLVAVADTDRLEGKADLAVDVQGKGLSLNRMKQNLKGTVDIALLDGAIHGVNVARLIRTSYAKIKGHPLSDEEQIQQTDFSTLNGSFVLAQGVATTTNLKMMSPLLRINGIGSIDYIKQILDLKVDTSVVGSLKGQGGKDIDELKDVTIPLKITGPWDKPKYRLVFDDVLKQKAKKELNRGLKKLDEKIKDEKTKEAVNQLLQGLFK